MATTATQATQQRGKGLESQAKTGRLFVLDIAGGRILSVNPDGSDKKIIVTDCPMPDGIVVDTEAGNIYWTNMGADVKRNDGSIERADLDGKNRTTIVPEGGTFTPKQLTLDSKNGKIYGAIARACASCAVTSMVRSRDAG